MEPLDVNGRRGAIWMFVSLLLSASDCTGISYRDQTMTEPKGGTAMFFFFTGTNSSEEHCTEHQIFKKN